MTPAIPRHGPLPRLFPVLGDVPVPWPRPTGTRAELQDSALLHTGVRLPVLPAFFHDPQIVGATVVEGLCAVFLGVSAFRINADKAGAWGTTVAAQVFAIAADTFGMLLIALGAGPDSPFNYLFHRLGIAILLLVLAALFARPLRNAFRSPRVMVP